MSSSQRRQDRQGRDRQDRQGRDRPERPRDPKLMFPARPGFSPRKGVHYSEKSLSIEPDYTDASAATELFLASADPNQTVLIFNAGIGTWPLAFSQHPKVTRVLAFVESENKILAENNTDPSLVSVFQLSHFERQLSGANNRFSVFYPQISDFPPQKVPVNRIGSFTPQEVKVDTSEWTLTSARTRINGPIVIIGERAGKAEAPNNDPDSQWFRGLQKFVYETLAWAIPNNSHRKMLVDQGSMTNVWYAVFTSSTVDSRVNYDTRALEFHGDQISGLTFSEWLRRNRPELSDSQMSNLKSHYMSEEFQPDLGRMMGLGGWVRVTRPAKDEAKVQEFFDKTMEDIFEAFFGGLRVAATNRFGFSVACEYCQNLMNWCMTLFELDMKYSKASARTQLEQLLPKWAPPIFGVPKPIGRGELEISVTLNPAARTQLQQRGFQDPGEVLTTVQGRGEKALRREAAEKALEYLESLRISTETAREATAEEVFKTGELRPLRRELFDQLDTLGYTNPRFEDLATKGNPLSTLVVDDEGETLSLATGEGESFQAARVAAVRDYLGLA